MNTADYSESKIAMPEAPVWLGLIHETLSGSNVCIIFGDKTQILGKLIGFNYKSKVITLLDSHASEKKELNFTSIAYLYFQEKHSANLNNIPEILKSPGVKLPNEKEDYKVILSNDSALEGHMISYVSDDSGVHIFKDEGSKIQRFFVPKSSIKSLSLGSKIGNELLSSNVLSAKQLSEALRNQEIAKNIKIGELLLEYDFINEDELEKILKIQESLKYKKNVRIGDLLVQENILTNKQLEQIIQVQAQKKNKKLGQILVDMGSVDDLEVSRIQANKLGIPLILLDKFKINKDVLNLIPYTDAKLFSALPLAIFDDRLLLAISDPFNKQAINAIQSLTDKIIEIAIAPEKDISHALFLYYGTEVIEDKLASLEAFHADSIHVFNNKLHSLDHYQNLINAFAPIETLNSILLNSIEKKAQVIYFKPTEYNIEIYFRYDDRLEKVCDFHKALFNLIIDRIKVMAELDIKNDEYPQAGYASIQYKNQNVNFVISILPTQFGTNLTVLFKGGLTDPTSLLELGISKKDKNILLEKIRNECGLIILIGPKMSGKTSSTYSIASELVTHKQNVVSLESPGERKIDGIEQVNLAKFPSISTFSFLNQVMLHQPDAIIWDAPFDDSTEKLLIQNSLQNCLVLITMQHNTLVEAWMKLISSSENSIELLKRALSLVIVQRLAKKNCEHCLEAESIEPPIATELGIEEKEKFYYSTGCEYCNGTGFDGIQLIYGIIDPAVNINSNFDNHADMDILCSKALIAAREQKISLAEVYRIKQSF